MSGWNGSGGFTLPYSWQADAAAGIDITASRMDTQFATISANGFNNTLTRDGQGSATADLPMNGFKHTGATIATQTGDYIVYQQITGGTLSGSFVNLTASGTLGVAGIATLGTAVVTTSLLVGSGVTILAGGLVVAGGSLTAGVISGSSITASAGISVGGGLTVGTGNLVTSAGNVVLTAGSVIQSTGNAPASASAAGAAGQTGWDSGFEYRCVATNTWVRNAHTTW